MSGRLIPLAVGSRGGVSGLPGRVGPLYGAKTRLIRVFDSLPGEKKATHLPVDDMDVDTNLTLAAAQQSKRGPNFYGERATGSAVRPTGSATQTTVSGKGHAGPQKKRGGGIFDDVGDIFGFGMTKSKKSKKH